MSLSQDVLAGVLGVSPPALRHIRKRHGIPLETMERPTAFLAALEMAGARKARIFRQLADPASRARIEATIQALQP